MSQIKARASVVFVSILTRPEGRVLYFDYVNPNVLREFQSSPVPKDGCYLCWLAYYPYTGRVSILTRPEGRVL